MDDFRTVAKVSEIRTGEMKLVDLDGEEVVIANVDGAFFAFPIRKRLHRGIS